MPSPERDRSDVVDPAELERKAKRTHEFHTKGLESLRLKHLTAEKYAIHVDGEGLGQWYDIVDRTRMVMIPVTNGFSPTQDNELQPIMDNFIAHLTTHQYRFVVNARKDRRSRQSAIIDQAIVNAEVRAQKWNYLMSEAKLLAGIMGVCAIHQMWRDDPSDAYETVMPGVQPGHIDAFVGNPFDLVLNAGAKRGSSHRRTWGRSLPADIVRAAFPQVTGLEGSDKIPSASAFQRIIRKWTRLGGRKHGHSELLANGGHEELIALIYDEILPGVDPDYPDGSLCIVALQGQATTRTEESRASVGNAVHLWSGPLPARRFSGTLVYSHPRFDDPYGKPYIADPDQDQIELNQRLAILKNYQKRASRPQLGGSGEVNADTVGPESDTYFELEAIVGAGAATLEWLQFPNAHIPPLLEEIQMIYDRMYRKAGWSAPSRGEAAGQSGKAIIALQTADDSIMGPITMRTSEELEEMAGLAWALRREFMDVPQVIEAVGADLAHLAEPYVDRRMMSEVPPQFQLTSQFGTSTEAIAQQLLNLMGVTDVYGEPVLTTRQFKAHWPDQSLYHEIDDPRDVRERRPRVVNEMIRQVAEQKVEELRAQIPQWQPAMGDPFTQQLGMIVEMEVAQREDVLMDDEMELCIDVLSIITQDSTEDPVARYAAIQRQQRYFLWLSGQQMQQAAAQTQQAAAGQAAKQGVKDQAAGQARPSAQEAFNPAREGGSANAQAMVQADKQFSKATA